MYQQALSRWLSEQERWVTDRANLLAFKDSVEIILEDSLLDPLKDEQLSALLDSTLNEPIWYDLFPYRGPNWDMARNYIAVYDSVFINPVKNANILRLKQELILPINPYFVDLDSLLNDTSHIDTFSTESVLPDSLSIKPFSKDTLSQNIDLTSSMEQSSIIDEYQSCIDLNITPSFRGGIQVLLSSISYPEGVIISPVNYRFFINERGIIDRFETVDSASNSVINPDLLDAINDRLESGVSFEPTIINGRSVRLVCEVVIDVSEPK